MDSTAFFMHRDWWALDNVTVLADALPQGWQALPQWQLTKEAAQKEIKDAQCCFGTDLCEHRRNFVRYDQERCNMTYPEYELEVPTRFDDGAYAVFGCFLVWLCRIVDSVAATVQYCVACYRGCCGKPDDETPAEWRTRGVERNRIKNNRKWRQKDVSVDQVDAVGAGSKEEPYLNTSLSKYVVQEEEKAENGKKKRHGKDKTMKHQDDNASDDDEEEEDPIVLLCQQWNSKVARRTNGIKYSLRLASFQHLHNHCFDE